MQYQVIIFDLDGLLIDSEVIYHRVSHELAGLLGREHRDEISARQMGRTPLESMVILREELGIESYSAQDLVDKRNQMMIREFRRELKPMPGALEILRRFHTHKRLAIGTGSPYLLANEALELLGLRDYFDLIVTSDQITKGKPDPEIYLRVANSLKVEPEYCIVLEDSSNGARSGCLAGCYVIAIPNVHTQQQDFTCVQARAANLYEASEMIARLNGIP